VRRNELTRENLLLPVDAYQGSAASLFVAGGVGSSNMGTGRGNALPSEARRRCAVRWHPAGYSLAVFGVFAPRAKKGEFWCRGGTVDRAGAARGPAPKVGWFKVPPSGLFVRRMSISRRQCGFLFAWKNLRVRTSGSISQTRLLLNWCRVAGVKFHSRTESY